VRQHRREGALDLGEVGVHEFVHGSAKREEYNVRVVERGEVCRWYERRARCPLENRLGALLDERQALRAQAGDFGPIDVDAVRLDAFRGEKERERETDPSDADHRCDCHYGYTRERFPFSPEVLNGVIP